MSKLNRFLEGVRVLDLSHYLPGPLATLLLADMGADVLKIEPPGGDGMTLIGPKGADGLSLYYSATNAGKATRRLDLRSAEGQDTFLGLVAEADIVVEGFRPGVMDRLGLGLDVLRGAKPDLITCSLSGFGANGPLAQHAGHDMNYLALNGYLSLVGPPEHPGMPHPPPADCTVGIMAVSAMLGALRHRDRTREPSHIDMSLTDAVMPTLTFSLVDLSVRGAPPARGREYLTGGAAYYGIYATADGGHVTLAPIEEKFWKRFCDAAERPDWLDRQQEPLPQTELRSEIATLIGSLTMEEAIARFEPADCCFAPVLDLEDAVNSEQLRARELVRKGKDGLWQALFPARVDDEPPSLRSPLKMEEN
ncbi:MAG: CoA transferase [Roseovarius sp.]